MIKCPACGFDNKADAKFCLNCGADLSKAAPPLGAYDPVGEEATVLIDPAQMQKRIAEEIKRDRAVEAVGRLMDPPPGPPHRSTGSHSAPPAPPPMPPAVVSAPPPVAPPPRSSGGSTVMVVGLIVVVGFLLLVVAGLIVVLIVTRS